MRVGIRVEVLARHLAEEHVAGADARAGEILAQRLVQTAQRPARRRVARRARPGRERCGRTDVHDDTATTREQRRHERVRHVPCGEERCPEHARELAVRRVLHPAPHPRARGVHDDIRHADRIEHPRGHRVDRVGVGCVERLDQRTSTGALDVTGDMREPLGTPCDEHDGPTTRAEQPCARRSDAARRARDDRDLTGVPAHPVSSASSPSRSSAKRRTTSPCIVACAGSS